MKIEADSLMKNESLPCSSSRTAQLVKKTVKKIPWFESVHLVQGRCWTNTSSAACGRQFSLMGKPKDACRCCLRKIWGRKKEGSLLGTAFVSMKLLIHPNRRIRSGSPQWAFPPDQAFLSFFERASQTVGSVRRKKKSVLRSQRMESAFVQEEAEGDAP